MNGGTSAERLQAAIASIPDLNGLGTMIPDVPAHSPVEARCKMCKRRIAAVAKTDEGPLFIGTIVPDFLLYRRNQLLKAHHVSPETDPAPVATYASWKPTYALLIGQAWHGDLSTHCPDDGMRPVSGQALRTALRTAQRRGKTQTIVL